MTIEDLITQKIVETLNPEHFELENQSHMHAGHAGDDGSGQTHFKLLVVSSIFDGCNRMQQHRLVYSAVGQLFPQGLHAFSMKTLTPSEYSQK